MGIIGVETLGKTMFLLKMYSGLLPEKKKSKELIIKLKPEKKSKVLIIKLKKKKKLKVLTCFVCDFRFDT